MSIMFLYASLASVGALFVQLVTLGHTEGEEKARREYPTCPFYPLWSPSASVRYGAQLIAWTIAGYIVGHTLASEFLASRRSEDSEWMAYAIRAIFLLPLVVGLPLVVFVPRDVNVYNERVAGGYYRWKNLCDWNNSVRNSIWFAQALSVYFVGPWALYEAHSLFVHWWLLFVALLIVTNGLVAYAFRWKLRQNLRRLNSTVSIGEHVDIYSIAVDLALDQFEGILRWLVTLDCILVSAILFSALLGAGPLLTAMVSTVIGWLIWYFVVD